jgi:hypothetical protein
MIMIHPMEEIYIAFVVKGDKTNSVQACDALPLCTKWSILEHQIVRVSPKHKMAKTFT